MTSDRPEECAPVRGEEFRPALAKLWIMLLVFLLLIPAGAWAAYSWWYQVALPGGKVLNSTGGIVGLLAVPLAAFLALVMFAIIATAKRLVIGEECLQLVAKGRVAVQIPYGNVADTYAKGEGGAGVVGLVLRDRADTATRVPSWTRDRYEIQVLTYGRPLDWMYTLVSKRTAEYRASHAAETS